MKRRMRGLQNDADALHEERSMLRLELARAAERLERLAERDPAQRGDLLERARRIRDKLRDSEAGDREEVPGQAAAPAEPLGRARPEDPGDPGRG